MPGYGATSVHERVGLVCPHCKLLLRKAVQTEDGVRLCQSCFKEIACLPGYHCDNCGITVHPDKFYPDRAVQRDVMHILIKCDHHISGCPWTGQLKEWENHTDECVFRTVKCPHKECEVVLPFNQLESHQQTCQFRRVTCEHCNTETSVSQQEHRSMGSEDHQDSTAAAEMLCKPVQETGDGTTETSQTVGTFCNANGVLLEGSSGLAGNSQTITRICASNAEYEEEGIEETSLPYAELSQEVGHNKPSSLVTGARAVDPEMTMVYHFLKLAFIIAVMAILLKSEKIHFINKPSPR